MLNYPLQMSIEDQAKKFRDNVKVEQSGSVDLKLSGAVSALPTPEEALKRLAHLAKRLPKKPKA